MMFDGVVSNVQVHSGILSDSNVANRYKPVMILNEDHPLAIGIVRFWTNKFILRDPEELYLRKCEQSQFDAGIE